MNFFFTLSFHCWCLVLVIHITPTLFLSYKTILMQVLIDWEEGWAPKNWCFQILWCWRRLLRGPWTARISNQPMLKEINPEYSLEGLMLKLKLQYFGHLMQKSNSLEKTVILGKTEGRRRRGSQKIRWLDGITDTIDISFSKLWETVKDREAWPVAVHGVAKKRTCLVIEQQQQLIDNLSYKQMTDDVN